MTDRKKEWIHYYGFLQTDEAKLALFAQLKQSKDKSERDALRELVERWVKE